MVRRASFVAVVGAILIGCALLVVGCAGVGSEAPKQEQQGQSHATEQEQGRSPEATASEDDRCAGTRSLEGHSVPAQAKPREPYLTNDVPGCPEGGPLSGTDGTDRLYGGEGADEIYAGEGDVVYSGDGADFVDARGAGQAKIYCGEGRDFYLANKDDYVSGSCEEVAEVTVMY